MVDLIMTIGFVIALVLVILDETTVLERIDKIKKEK